MKHENIQFCQQCMNIFNRYPGFNENLKSWFFSFKEIHKEMHISCAGRGEIDQEAAFLRGASKAKWGESSHNYNCAIDIFVMIPGNNSIYPRDWFNNVLGPAIPNFLNWYGQPGSPFYELPHIEVRGWKELVAQGIIKLVE